MNTKPLSFGLLRLDAGTQSRLAINDDTVEDYAEILRATPPDQWPFPPLDVFHDGNPEEYFMGDGFHRCLGAVKAGRVSAPCIIHKGNAKDARIFSMTANDRHGVRMTRADKRACVVWCLECGDKMTQVQIAKTAGVGLTLVKKVVSERNPASIAGKASPLQQDSKGRNVPSTPSSGGSERFGDWEPEAEPVAVATHAGNGRPSSNGKPAPKPMTAKTGRESDIWQAQQVMKTWIDAIGRWMNGNPAGIDVYREQFPGPLGDMVIDSAKALLNALDAWKKALK